jgi:hypothetical protein
MVHKHCPGKLLERRNRAINLGFLKPNFATECVTKEVISSNAKQPLSCTLLAGRVKLCWADTCDESDGDPVYSQPPVCGSSVYDCWDSSDDELPPPPPPPFPDVSISASGGVEVHDEISALKAIVSVDFPHLKSLCEDIFKELVERMGKAAGDAELAVRMVEKCNRKVEAIDEDLEKLRIGWMSPLPQRRPALHVTALASCVTHRMHALRVSARALCLGGYLVRAITLGCLTPMPPYLRRILR